MIQEKNFKPLSAAQMEQTRGNVEKAFDQLCTLCRYCEVCPNDIPVSKYMSAYNYRVLETDKAMKDWLKWHWGLEEAAPGVASVCTQCGECESRCTQHLPIIERLQALSATYVEEEKSD